MSKLVLHVQVKDQVEPQPYPAWLNDFHSESGVQYVKGVLGTTSAKIAFPGVRTIVRPYMPDSESNRLIWQGAEGADQWYVKWRAWMHARNWAWAFEGPNEPQPMRDGDFRKALDTFTVRLAEHFSNGGLRLVGHNWGVAWPNPKSLGDFAASVRALHDGGHLLGLHEYSAKAMWDGVGYYCLRYRKTVEELRGLGVPIPRVFVGECGIDGGVISQPRKGWQEYASQGEYLAQLAWYDAELMSDDYVLAAAIFTVCDWDWASFNVTEELGMALARYIAATPTPAQPPAPPPPKPAPEVVLEFPLKRRWRTSSSFVEHQTRTPPSNAPGVDLACSLGTPVYAVAAGKIAEARWRDGGGRSLKLLMPDGWWAYYAHLDSFAVAEGEVVYKNELIGFSGNTAKVLVGPHLHFSLMGPNGKWVNPEPLFT